ncbi:putative U-box domain-containing protein 42 [Silene latifolia]|uniref:putative U-box domain-containing protein 42 n=1 Tax=Silene latifolia TaxID=37657 RepID=UPI003D783195
MDQKDVKLSMNVCESYLASLAEITASIEKFKIEQDSLIEIGCYLYRAASVISQIAEISPENSIGILQSLLRNSHLAKGLLEKLQESGENTLEAELKNTIQELGGIINHIGKDLSSVPVSAFKNKKYIEIAVCSLSEEMRGSPFRISPVPESKPIPEIKASYQRWESNLKDQSDIESTPTEVDDYSISTEVRTGYSHISDMPHLLDALRSTSQGSHMSTGNRFKRSSANSSRKSQHVEPLYNSFICPLTKVIMDDPVTIQSGVTYERKAITEYFESFGSEEVLCPVTMEKVEGRNMSPNIALRNTINEWKDRDETSRLRVIHEALSIDSTDDRLLEALTRLKVIWEKNPQKVLQVRNITPLIVRLLEVKSRNVRCAALEMICLLAHEEEQKELIGKTSAIPLTVRLLSSSYQPIKHGVLLLLIELSKSKSLSEKIGCITGGILILIRTTYNRSSDTFASEAANQVLKNMEQFSDNIKIMADNGYLEPLLNNLIEGVEERKLEMVTYLGEIILENDRKTHVAERTSPVLAEMMQNGDPSTRLAVFKALTQISSHTESGKILVKSGIIGTMVQEMFSSNIFSGPIETFREALAVLTNILESGVELENLMVNSQGKTMISGYILFNIIYMIKSSTPEDLKMSLIQILYHMAKSTKTAAQVLSAVKESEVSYTLIELLNNPRDEIAISALKLLTLLLSQMGNLLIERLCKTDGLPEGLVQSTSNPVQYTERQALSATFLAKVPHQNVTLNLALVRRNTIPGILQSISQILRSGARHDKYASMYLEGLVGTVVRITATLYEPQMLFVAMDYNFTSVLTELLTETSSDEVQRLAATGLEKLSSQSVHLSRKPQKKRKKFLNLFYLPKFLLFESSRKTKIKLCIVHKGVCFGQNTMCLIEAKAVERLLKCLEHENAEVAEAALSAISTLLDDKVDQKQSVKMLSEMNAIQQVLKAIRQHKIESLWQKAFWMMERFLTVGGQGSVAIVSHDKLFFVTVVTAFHHGDAYTKQMAEKILRYLNRVPNYTDTFTM